MMHHLCLTARHLAINRARGQECSTVWMSLVGFHLVQTLVLGAKLEGPSQSVLLHLGNPALSTHYSAPADESDSRGGGGKI